MDQARFRTARRYIRLRIQTHLHLLILTIYTPKPISSSALHTNTRCPPPLQCSLLFSWSPLLLPEHCCSWKASSLLPNTSIGRQTAVYLGGNQCSAVAASWRIGLTYCMAEAQLGTVAVVELGTWPRWLSAMIPSSTNILADH